MRVRQLRRRLRLAREAQPNGGVVRELRRQHLDRDRAVEAEVAGAVDDGHAAAPDFAFDVVLLAERGDDAVVERIAHAPRCVRGPIVTTSTLAGHTTSTPAPGPTFRTACLALLGPEHELIPVRILEDRRASPVGRLGGPTNSTPRDDSSSYVF